MNVLVDDNLRAVLIDFNNSVVVQPHHRDRQLASTVLGTATYWAPELTRPGAVQTVESEIWAIGCVIIEVCRFGYSAFQIRVLIKVTSHQVYTAIAPWKRYGNEGISKITAALMEGETPVLETEATHPEVWDLLKECWAKEPANRPSLQGMMGRLP
jgi:serine/threonine protein kinase